MRGPERRDSTTLRVATAHYVLLLPLLILSDCMGWAAKPRAAAVAAGCLIQPRLFPAWPACGWVSVVAHLT